MPIFRRLRAGFEFNSLKVRLFVFAFFTQPSPNDLLLTGPTPSRDLGARSKTAPASPSETSAAVTLLAFADLFHALPRAARCLPHL
jgi:hypothetical protein